MNTPVREGETIEGSRTMRNRPYPVLKCSRHPGARHDDERRLRSQRSYADLTRSVRKPVAAAQRARKTRPGAASAPLAEVW